MNILLVQDDAQVRERVAFVLDSQFNSTVIQAETLDQAKAVLDERFQEINLIVIDCDPAQAKFFDKLRAEFSQVQALVFLRKDQTRQAISTPPGHPLPVFIDRTDIVQNITTAVGAMIKKSVLPNPNDDRNYCQISTKLLLSVAPLKADIFIKLGELKYLKLMRQGDTFDLQDLEKFTVKKGVEYLYLRKKEIKEFIRKFQNELLSLLNLETAMPMQEVAALNDSSLETIQSLSAGGEFTPEVQEIAKTQVQLTLKAMGSSPDLEKVFDMLTSYKGKYISSHGTMTGYLACMIAARMSWGSNTTFHKLTLAAFLHDIMLTNHDLAACQSIAETQDKKFTDDERVAFKKHPTLGAQRVKEFREVPPDVDTIIAQHHELPDGSGFPRGLSSQNIAPLAAVFIVAHDMARYAIAQKSAFSVSAFAKAAHGRYTSAQFRKVMQALDQF